MILMMVTIPISIVSSVSASFVDDQYEKVPPNYESRLGYVIWV